MSEAPSPPPRAASRPPFAGTPQPTIETAECESVAAFLEYAEPNKNVVYCVHIDCQGFPTKGLAHEVYRRWPDTRIFDAPSDPRKPTLSRTPGQLYLIWVYDRFYVGLFAGVDAPGAPSEKETEMDRLFWFSQCLLKLEGFPDQIGLDKAQMVYVFPRGVGGGDGGDPQKYRTLLETFHKATAPLGSRTVELGFAD